MKESGPAIARGGKKIKYATRIVIGRQRHVSKAISFHPSAIPFSTPRLVSQSLGFGSNLPKF